MPRSFELDGTPLVECLYKISEIDAAMKVAHKTGLGFGLDCCFFGIKFSFVEQVQSTLHHAKSGSKQKKSHAIFCLHQAWLDGNCLVNHNKGDTHGFAYSM